MLKRDLPSSTTPPSSSPSSSPFSSLPLPSPLLPSILSLLTSLSSSAPPVVTVTTTTGDELTGVFHGGEKDSGSVTLIEKGTHTGRKRKSSEGDDSGGSSSYGDGKKRSKSLVGEAIFTATPSSDRSPLKEQTHTIPGPSILFINFPARYTEQKLEREASDVLKRKEVERVRRSRNYLRKKGGQKR